MTSTNEGEGLRNRLLRPLLWSVIAAAAAYGASMIVSDFSAVQASIARLGLSGWIVVLCLSLANYGLRYVRWELYLARLNHRVPPLQSLVYYIGGFAFTTTPGKLGEAIRSVYLVRHGVPYIHSLAAYFTERFVDLVAMVLLALAAALTFPQYQWPVILIALIIFSLLPVVHAKSFHSFAERRVSGIRSPGIRSFGARIVDLLRLASTLLASGPMIAGLLLALLAWSAEGIAFHLILDVMQVELPLALTIGIYAVSILVGALSFIPGGLGTTEAVMVLLLTIVGADLPTAIAATVICRLATLWFAVVLGVFALAAIEMRAGAELHQVKKV